MSTVKRGLLVALIQVLIVSSLGGVLLWDRATKPRLWVKTAPVDPDLPFRGRYVRLRLLVDTRGFESSAHPSLPATLSIENERLVAVPALNHSPTRVRISGEGTATLAEPLAYFIPEHVDDPSIRPAGEELWVEVTLPRKGPPRPIRLGLRQSEAVGDPRPLVLE